ncbi:hypothetical protein IM816_14855 [Luteibacter flocculans]|uniref:Methyltransferase domain-containing protein n=1 Tax=Luteibacter flocculans TaxID=2780091 RepID=A0ABY4T1R0_9GAMM|nr:class I SAM-dependent methyltransferase [Luteibacter flocculans]URL57877.1 hypothetical protein IM816_14855 [Luteibacter flocculans]
MASLASTVSLLEQEAGWRDLRAFLWRAEASDTLELLLLGEADPAERERAVALLEAMEAVDRDAFALLRAAIQRGEGREALAPWLDVGFPTGQHYDVLDHVIAGVLAIEEPDTPLSRLPPEMVFYQPTPARHIVDGVLRAAIAADDVVLDLGSGLGHVPILVHVLTGATARGVEREPAYVTRACEAARALQLAGVTMRVGDARDAEFTDVTVFYLFTPFIGTVLRDVMARIEHEARRRPIRVVTLGPCSRTFARMPWLHSDDPDPEASDRIVVFRSALGGR